MKHTNFTLLILAAECCDFAFLKLTSGELIMDYSIRYAVLEGCNRLVITITEPKVNDATKYIKKIEQKYTLSTAVITINERGNSPINQLVEMQRVIGNDNVIMVNAATFYEQEMFSKTVQCIIKSSRSCMTGTIQREELPLISKNREYLKKLLFWDINNNMFGWTADDIAIIKSLYDEIVISVYEGKCTDINLPLKDALIDFLEYTFEEHKLQIDFIESYNFFTLHGENDIKDIKFSFVETTDSSKDEQQTILEFEPPNIMIQNDSVTVEIIRDMDEQSSKEYADVFDIPNEEKRIDCNICAKLWELNENGFDLTLKNGWNGQFDDEKKHIYFAYCIVEGEIYSTNMLDESAFEPARIKDVVKSLFVYICKLYCRIEKGKIVDPVDQFNDGNCSEYCGYVRMFQSLSYDGLTIANVVITKESDFADFIERTKKQTAALKTKAIVFEIIKHYNKEK